ncbi:MAG TPA: hypothetical protein VN838_12110 [Bradyrhizobium sp.]|nr:hypothetical protein [Bradyrhizobium sp.]
MHKLHDRMRKLQVTIDIDGESERTDPDGVSRLGIHFKAVVVDDPESPLTTDELAAVADSLEKVLSIADGMLGQVTGAEKSGVEKETEH